MHVSHEIDVVSLNFSDTFDKIIHIFIKKVVMGSKISTTSAHDAQDILAGLFE